MLFYKEFKFVMNLTSVRKDCRNEPQIILLCDLTVFSHFLTMPNLQRSLSSLITCPGLTINSCHHHIDNNFLT